MSSFSSSSSSSSIKLYYWPALGRGEFIRLLAAEAGVSIEEMFEGKSFPEIIAAKNQLQEKFPFFALPAIEYNGILTNQTPVILRFLAQRLDNGRFYPKNEVDSVHAESIVATIVDVVAEGHDAWHAIDKNASYKSQADACIPFINYFKTKRLPRYLNFIESLLTANKNSQFIVGNEISYADIVVYHWLDGVEFQCKDILESSNLPKTLEYKKRIGERPAIKKRIAERKMNFDGTGPIF